ncbi:hypothetical protein M422DRAFT_169430, partial [Sphaerobolus stellatus SS14]
KLSKLWVLCMANRGKLHIYYHQLHQTYGPVVRIGPNQISVIDVELIPDIMSKQGMPRGPSLCLSRSLNSMSCWFDMKRHSELRKIWNKGFAPSPMKDYEEAVVERAMQLVTVLKNLCNEPSTGIAQMNLAQKINYFT